MILAGDIGGTKVHVALFTGREHQLRLVAERRVATRRYSSLEEILQEFLHAQHATIHAACFGIAGPVINGRCKPLNVPWMIDTQQLQRALRIRRVHLLNDLEALAYGIGVLPPRAFATLNPGCEQPHGTIAVIAAGTGLGEAVLVWDGARYRAIPSEGGHTEFGPRTPLEVELWRYARARFGHVSYERVVSGPGKVVIYEFLKATGRGQEPAWLRKQFIGTDQSVVISDRALDGRSALCVKALDLFVSIYGAEAGNLALKALATGGVYIGGGIAPAIMPKMQDGTFMKAFTDKGRLSSVVSRIPVRVILEQKAGLYGAAAYAARMRSRSS